MNARFLTLGLCAALLACGPSAPIPDDGQPNADDFGDPGTITEPPTGIETYELLIPEDALAKFAADPWAPEQPATFIYGDRRYPVMVRLRGASARTFPKKSWNLDFEDLRFQGREEVNLVAEYQDHTMLVEKLGYDLMAAMDVPAPRTKYVKVILNGEYQGVYLDIEEVDRKFLKARALPDTDATIYRCGIWDCELKTWRLSFQSDWEKVTNEDEAGRPDLDALLDVVNHAPEPEFVTRLERIFEVDRFLRLMAVEAVIANNYIEDSRSYYVSDRVTGRMYYVPWDLNNSDARFWPTYGLDMTPVYDHPLWAFTLQDSWLDARVARRGPLYPDYEPTFCNLRTRVMLNPELRERVLAYTEQARRELFSPEILHPWVDATRDLLEPLMKDDPYIDQQRFALGRQFVKDFIARRSGFVDAELIRLRNQLPGLMIEAFDPAVGWIELSNRGAQPVSTQGRVITTHIRRGKAPSNVPAATLAPGQRVRFTAAELGLSFTAQGQVGLFDGTAYAGALDVLFYGALPAGSHYARGASGAWSIAR